MALRNDVKGICNRLARHGWKELFDVFGLNITATNLQAELDRPLPAIDRKMAGFEDFCQDGVKGIEPGSPARSLLYHALASPLVHPHGSPPFSPQAYPTLEELDIIENYVYGQARRKLADFAGVVVAVFAYQYRIAPRSPHGQFADLAFSRTGLSRVGTTTDHYDPARRSFWPVPADGGDAIAVMPARYAAFLAERRQPAATDAILGEQANDHDRFFLFPVHKLFAGSECLEGTTIAKLEFLERHISEKLRKIHTRGGVPGLPQFDLNAEPFVRDSAVLSGMVGLRRAGASVLVIPQDHPQLVRAVMQKTRQHLAGEITRFLVPAASRSGGNRFITSFWIEAGRAGRSAPEFINIRHKVNSPTNPANLQDLNQLPNPRFEQLLNAGGYEAAHFIDDSCEGCIVAEVDGLAPTIPAENHFPAYSLVSAPDFFPLVDQAEITNWAQRVLGNERDQFAQGGPEPLSDGRDLVNPDLLLPPTSAGPQLAFPPGLPGGMRNDTVTAIIAAADSHARRDGRVEVSSLEDPSTNFLPDAASSVFDPGWDVSQAHNANGDFYAAYGLGSPFPEDAKLCAALNSFWPAVAPDASRTFGPQPGSPTAIPMLDAELGYHPDHPVVQAGSVKSQPGWDGEFGPFFENGHQFVNYSNIRRSDYVNNALNGLIRLSGLARITAGQFIRRMEALRACIRFLPAFPVRRVSGTELFLVTADRVEEWSSRPDRGDPRLHGDGYLFVFAVLDKKREEQTNDPRRLRSPVLDSHAYTCQLTRTALCWRQEKPGLRFKFQLL